MAATTEIITATEVISLALQSPAFDEAYIERFILPAQRAYIKTFLGKDYYEEITTEFENTATMTADNTALVYGYLRPCLAYYVVYDALPQIAVKIDNKGLMIGESETSTPASSKDKEFIRIGVLSMAQRWEKDASEFIFDQKEYDSSKYPLISCGTKNSNKYFI